MPHPVNLRQIEAFRSVMVAGSTTRAATEIGISQPAISRLLRDLEYLVGCPLFDRRQGRLIPTPEGEALFQETHALMNGYDRVSRAIKNLSSLKTGHLHIIATNPMAHGLLPQTMARFREIHPDITISVGITVRREARSWMDAQEFDLAVTTLPLDYPARETRRIAKVYGVLVLPQGHPLTEKDEVEAQDLADAPFISLVPETLARFQIDMLFQRLGIERSMVMETQTATSICEFVAQGLGVSITDPFTANRFIGHGIEIRPFRPAIHFEYGCLFPLQRPHSRLAESFYGCVLDSMAEFQPYMAR